MASIYEIKYKFKDELNEGGWRTSYVCVYETDTAEGDTIQHTLDLANEDGDFTGVDKLMGKLFGLKDEDIAFYFDISDIVDRGTSRLTRLVPELQKSFDIVINDIWAERTSNG